MTALRCEAIHLVEEMPEDQIPYIIQYMHTLKRKRQPNTKESPKGLKSTPQMCSFLELEEMLIPISSNLDYKKELAATRNEKYGYIN